MNTQDRRFLAGMLTLAYGLTILLMASFFSADLQGTIHSPAWRRFGKVISIFGLCLVGAITFARFLVRQQDDLPQAAPATVNGGAASSPIAAPTSRAADATFTSRAADASSASHPTEAASTSHSTARAASDRVDAASAGGAATSAASASTSSSAGDAAQGGQQDDKGKTMVEAGV